MKLLLLFSFLLIPSLVAAQESAVVSNSECAAVLAAPPFVDILTRNEGKDFHELSPVKSGPALLGLECSVDELTKFFEAAGWTFLQFEEKKLLGPLKMGDGAPDYYIDAAVGFCLKRPTLFGMFGFRCRPMASVYLHEGLISGLHTSMNK